MWKELYERLRIVDTPGYAPLPKPSPATFAEYESATSFRLPPSYREYAAVFGPGEIGAYARIRAPGYPDDEGSDLAECDRFKHEGDNLLCEIYGDPERIRRLVFFATSFTGDIFGWDPAEVTDPATPEYAVWGLPRNGQVLVRVADTFPAFVEGVLQGSVGEAMGYDFGTTDEERREFVPWVQKPSQAARGQSI
jgi:hypothetical protein